MEESLRRPAAENNDRCAPGIGSGERRVHGRAAELLSVGFHRDHETDDGVGEKLKRDETLALISLRS
jgi:hypothetical protein